MSLKYRCLISKCIVLVFWAGVFIFLPLRSGALHAYSPKKLQSHAYFHACI